ncbi:MAG: radical SAM protein [Flavobacteriales bacterium]|nr:radical SAM protein [Flavobacteriales bacterium]
MNSYLKKINKKMAPSNYMFGPEWIVLGVNNVCNLHCKMCDVGTANLETNFAQNLVGSHPLNMPLELFKTVVDQAADFWPNVKLGYAFTEPLVYPDLKESLAYANDKGLFTSITTNALNLKRKATDLVEAGLNELYISLDGLEETHNYIRGNKKSFQKAIEGIQFITSLKGAPSVSVFCVITEWNFEELVGFTEFFRELPIKHVGFMHPNFVTEEMASVHNAMCGNHYPATHSNVEETDMGKVDLVKLQAQISRIKSTEFPFTVSFSPELNSLEELEKFYLRPMEKIGRNCSDVFKNMMVKTDGTVIPAHGRCYNLDVGNVYKDDLKTIWRSPVLSKLRLDLNKAGGLFPGCNRCCSGV